jgi:hypothetical protein
MLMRANHRRIEHERFQIGRLQCAEDLLPHSRLGPAVEPLIDRIRKPNRSGRSRHGAPVRAIQITASTNNRLSSRCVRRDRLPDPATSFRSDPTPRLSVRSVGSSFGILATAKTPETTNIGLPQRSKSGKMSVNTN